MPRRLEWIKSDNFQGFGCSECYWKFRPSGAIAGDSLDDMKKKYEAERDKEFPSTFASNAQIHRSNDPAGSQTKFLLKIC